RRATSRVFGSQPSSAVGQGRGALGFRSVDGRSFSAHGGGGRFPLRRPSPHAAGTGYFFSSYSPSRWDFNCSAFSHFRSSSLAVSPLTFHLKLNSVPTGTFSATCFFAFSLPSNPETLALTSPSFSTV